MASARPPPLVGEEAKRNDPRVNSRAEGAGGALDFRGLLWQSVSRDRLTRQFLNESPQAIRMRVGARPMAPCAGSEPRSPAWAVFQRCRRRAPDDRFPP